MHDLDVLIIGAGHNGLAMSGLLADAGRESLVVDRRERLGGAWQDHWDEFRLVTPNWTTSLPGWPYDGPDPDGFMTRDEIAARVARYAGVVGATVQLGTEVLRLSPLLGGGFRAATSRGDLTAREVVVATGSFHEPRIPDLAAGVSQRVTQLHSHVCSKRSRRDRRAGPVLRGPAVAALAGVGLAGRPRARRPLPRRADGGAPVCNNCFMNVVQSERPREAIVRLSHRGLGVREFSLAAARVLRRSVAFDGVCAVTLDPATLLPTGPM